jgi:hypothetical protein
MGLIDTLRDRRRRKALAAVMMADLAAERERFATAAARPATSETYATAERFLGLAGLEPQLVADRLEQAVRQRATEAEESEPSEQSVHNAAVDVLQAEGRGFVVDWKWGGPRNLLENYIAALIPGLSYQIERDDLTGHQWQLSYVIMGRRLDAAIDGSIPMTFVDALNPILTEATGQTLVSYSTGGDDHAFLLVPAENVAQLVAERFWPILGS